MMNGPNKKKFSVEIHILLQDLIKINKPAVDKYQTPFLLSESKYSNSSLWIPLGIILTFSQLGYN